MKTTDIKNLDTELSEDQLKIVAGGSKLSWPLRSTGDTVEKPNEKN